MLRTEEWQLEQQFPTPEPIRDEEGEVIEEIPAPPPMINTALISVWEDEKVWIQPEAAGPYGFDTSKAKEITPEGQQRFVWEFSYDDAKAALEDRGWTYVSSTEA